MISPGGSESQPESSGTKNDAAVRQIRSKHPDGGGIALPRAASPTKVRQRRKASGRSDETVYITEEFIAELVAEMLAAADALEFERAAAIRDRIERMQENIGEPVDAVKKTDNRKRGKGRNKARVPRPKKGA
ncbi:MAG: UvrB/UvrC motif-containing protein [Planctomycetales bacterium]|nr:UvrB/UvrC motif-containing protein [Planctomycetales bacterium]